MSDNAEAKTLTKEEAIDYFFRAADARVTIERNKKDYEFAESDGVIRYIVDPSILYFFQNPKKNLHHVSLLFDPNEHQSPGTATCTAEFIMSGQLSGQWGQPCYLAPSHQPEFINLLVKLTKKIKEDGPYNVDSPEFTSKEAATKLAQLVQTFKRSKFTPNEIESLISDLENVLGSLSIGTVIQAKTIKRLYENDLMRPLETLPEAHVDIDEEDVEDWFDRITEMRENTTPLGASHSKVKEDKTDNTRRDAEVISQIIALNNNAKKEFYPKRYVYLTADQSVYLAYSYWFFSEGGPGYIENDYENEFFCIRRPTQYMPVLNTKQMPNEERGKRSAQIIRKVEYALDGLLYNIKELDEQYPSILPEYYYKPNSKYDIGSVLSHYSPKLTLEADEKISRIKKARAYAEGIFHEQDGRTSFEDIRKDWLKASKDAVALNVQLLHKRYAILEDLAESLLDNDNLRENLIGHIETSLTHLEGNHMAIALRYNLIERAKKNAPHKRATDSNHPQTAISPINVRGKFFIDHFISEPTTTELWWKLGNIAANINSEENQAVFDRITKNTDDAVTCFFAACIAFYSNHWEAGAQYAWRALDILNKKKKDQLDRNQHEELEHEIRFFFAVALRHTIPDRPQPIKILLQKTERADDQLTLCCSYHSKKTVLLRRTLAERTVLNITKILYIYFSPDNKNEMPRVMLEKLHEIYSISIRDLERFICLLKDEQNSAGGVSAHAAKLSVDEALLNSILLVMAGAVSGLLLIDFFCLKRQTSIPQETIDWASRTLEISYGGLEANVTALYTVGIDVLSVCRSGSDEHPKQPESILRETAKFIDDYKDNEANDPTPWDKTILSHFRNEFLKPNPFLSHGSYGARPSKIEY